MPVVAKQQWTFSDSNQKGAEIRFYGNHGIGILEISLPCPGQQFIQRIEDALLFRLQGLNELPHLLIRYCDDFQWGMSHQDDHGVLSRTRSSIPAGTSPRSNMARNRA